MNLLNYSTKISEDNKSDNLILVFPLISSLGHPLHGLIFVPLTAERK